MDNLITTGLLGLAVADAVGVPVEFRSREEMDADPVTDIRGYGTYNQPPGYFSDDSSLAFGLAESLATGSFNLADQARRLINYKLHGYWTPEDRIFDIGVTTSQAIDRLIYLAENDQYARLPKLRETASVRDNGNGALMRIFPLYAYLRHRPMTDWLQPTWLHSALTHGHERSAWCCFLYLRFCHHTVSGLAFREALDESRGELRALMKGRASQEEFTALDVLLNADFTSRARSQVQGNGYVVQSLEAALWSLAQATDYRSAVLNAVNLGEDTDTTACIVGAPAALRYGRAAIPENWLAALARREDIEELGMRLEHTVFE